MPSLTNQGISYINLFLYELEVLGLALLIAMDQTKFAAFLKRALCGHSPGAISHLQLQLTGSAARRSFSGADFTLEMAAEVVNATTEDS